MTATEAFKLLLKANYSSSIFMRCRSCLDFGSFYAFCVAPIDVKDDDAYFTGTVFDSVDKKTGRIFEYDITSDPDAYENAEVVSVSTILDARISSL